MKYRELYDYAQNHEFTVVEFDTNVMPQKGWAVPTFMYAQSYAYIEKELYPDLTPEERFDYQVDLLTKLHSNETVLIATPHYLGKGVVFANQQYAMGYAHAKRVDYIIDCFTGKKVVRK